MGTAVPAAANAYVDFFRAIQADNVSALMGLYLRGFDLNTRSEKLEPPLHLSLQLGALKAADFLISRREVDLEARNPLGETALMIAAIRGHVAQARAMILRGAQVNQTGWTALHYAASHDGDASVPMLQLLLEHSAYIDAESPNQTTPLMMAAMYGTSAAVSVLLEAGADVSLRNAQGLSAIDFARRADRPRDAERMAAAVRKAQSGGKW